MQNPSIEETRLLPLVLAPTTAGTGSEATPNAIVTDTSRNMKVGIVNQAFIPDTVILDPAFTMTLPQSVTAATGMDALAHALECYISKKANPISDTYAIEAMRLIFSNLLTAYQQPDHADARHAMLYAAFLAVSVLQPLPQPRCMRLRIRWAESITFRMECRMRCYFLRLWSLIEASLQISSIPSPFGVWGFRPP